MANNMNNRENVIELNTEYPKNSDYNNDNNRRINYQNESVKNNENICKRTTKIEKIIGISILAITIVFMILFLTKETSPHTLNLKEIEKNDVCYSTECIENAAFLLNNMDQSISPCDNFYNYACGNFIKTTSIPDDKDVSNMFSPLEDNLFKQLKKIILEKNDNDIKTFKMVKDFFSACMNTTKLEEIGLEPITNISNKLGGWPLLQNKSVPDSWVWEDTVIKFRELGISIDYIFEFSVQTDYKNSSRKIISIDQPILELSREFLINGTNHETVKLYYKYMVDIAVIFGADVETAKTELKKSLEFEIELAKICVPSEDRRDAGKLHNILSIAKLQLKYPYIKWSNYFNHMFKKINVNETEIINLTAPTYFEKLGPLLKKTPHNVIANYLFWRFYKFSASFSIQKITDRESEYKSEISGAKEKKSRLKVCLHNTIKFMPAAVGALYVRQYFSEKSKASVTELHTQIHQSFRNILSKVDWMDEITRKAALLKMDNMNAFIGYPNELLDDEKINNYYENLNINKSSYFESILNMTIFHDNLAISKLRETSKRPDWENYSGSAVINAFYSPSENLIHFPAGILQNRIYSIHRPNYINFGALGAISGHETVHGFDDEGRQYDLNGNLVDWWANDTKNLFAEKAQCIVQQYGNYVDNITGLKLNGINTQGENIADNGGFKAAYFAYNNWVKKNGPELKLPGLQNFTSNQMYWISAAQTWCSVERPESLKQKIATDVHSPPYFRVVGSFSNIKEFSSDFNCKEGDKMNPINKCQVW